MKMTLKAYFEKKGDLSPLWEHGFEVGDYEGHKFMIVPGWEEIKKLIAEVEEYVELKPIEGRDTKYNTEKLEQIVKLITGEEDSWGFDDEYTFCCDCRKVINISPDSYAWTPSYTINEWGYYCLDCVKACPEEYISDILNNARKANTIFTQQELEEFGFEVFENEKESGWYHRSDNPMEQAKHVPEGYDYIFHITNQEQFRTNWVMMIRKQGE